MISFVKLVNRTSKVLSGQWDGKQFSFQPGVEYTFPELQALKFKEQNPLMGSEDYVSGYRQFLIGIVEQGDDCSPIEASGSVEAWDRSTIVLPPGTKIEVLKGRGYNPSLDRGRPLPQTPAVMESIEPTPGFDTESVTIAGPEFDFKP